MALIATFRDSDMGKEAIFEVLNRLFEPKPKIYTRQNELSPIISINIPSNTPKNTCVYNT